MTGNGRENEKTAPANLKCRLLRTYLLEKLVIGMLRLGGVKNISAGLRHYGWKACDTLTLSGLPRNNYKTLPWG